MITIRNPAPDVDRRAARRGMTVADVLVVLALLVLGAALALPKALSAREQARRATCVDNLRQIGTAMYAFADGHDASFPPGRYNTPHQHGWAPFLLPYLNLSFPAERYRWDVDFFDKENEPVVKVPLPMFLCPAVPENPRIFTISDVTGGIAYGPGAPSDYFAVGAVFDDSYATPRARRGAVENNVVTPLAEFVDGTSYTFLVTEAAGRPAAWCQGRKVADENQVNARWWGAWAAFNSYGLQGFGEECTQDPGPFAVNRSNGRGIYAFHQGGANALMADGSVRFLAERLDLMVMYALATRAAGEIIDWDDVPQGTQP